MKTPIDVVSMVDKTGNRVLVEDDRRRIVAMNAKGYRVVRGSRRITELDSMEEPVNETW